MSRHLSVLVCLIGASAFGYSSGISGYSKAGCSGCHGGGGTPNVQLSGPSTLTAGSSGDYSLTISGGAGGCGGLDVSASGGTLSLSGSDGPSEETMSGEVTNNGQASFSGSSLVYTFTVKAGTGSSLTIYAAGLSGCSRSGSDSAQTSYSVTIGPASQPPTVAQAASASPSTITGSTTQVSVLGASSAGESTLTYTWSGSGGVTFSPNGTNAAKSSTATFPGPGNYTLTATIANPANQTVQSSTNVVVNSQSSQPPTITQPAAPAQPVVTSTSVSLSVQATDPMGGSPSYSWSATGPQPVTFSVNGSGAAANTVATFGAAGTYGVSVTVTGAGGSTVSNTSVTVNPTTASVSITPQAPTVQVGMTQAFSASAMDQFGNALAQPAVIWSASGDGTVDNAGNFTAGSLPGSATVTAAVDSQSATATVTVTPAPSTVVTSGSTSVQWLAPISGEQLAGVVLLRAAASDPDGIANVTFLVDGVTQATVDGPSYEMRWDTSTAPDGDHVLTAQATSTSGTTVSATLPVSVHNGNLIAQGGCSSSGGAASLLALALATLALRRRIRSA